MKIEAPTGFSNNFLSRFMFVTESSASSQNFMKERYDELKSKLDRVAKEHDKMSECTDELEAEISIKNAKISNLEGDLEDKQEDLTNTLEALDQTRAEKRSLEEVFCLLFLVAFFYLEI